MTLFSIAMCEEKLNLLLHADNDVAASIQKYENVLEIENILRKIIMVNLFAFRSIVVIHVKVC